MDTLREVEPTCYMAVPRIWEKIMERVQEAMASSGFFRRRILLWAMSVMLEQNLTCPDRCGGQEAWARGSVPPPVHNWGSTRPARPSPTRLSALRTLCRGSSDGRA